MDISDQEFKQSAGKLLRYMMERLSIQAPPTHLILKQSEDNAKKPWGYTGNYDPTTKTITLFTTNRHHVDILRSFAHEVIHHWQNEHGQLLHRGGKANDPQYAQKDEHMRKMEKQAYLLGNIIFRDFEDIERHGQTDIVNEGVERYFMLGNGPEDFRWIWVNGQLKYDKGGSHQDIFGDELNKAQYKGRYDVGEQTLTFVFLDRNDPNARDKHLPKDVYKKLWDTFKFEHLEIF